MIPINRPLLLLLLLLLIAPPTLTFQSLSFLPRTPYHPKTSPTSTTSLHLFDFFGNKVKEGVTQLANLAQATKEGNITKGFEEVNKYVDQENELFSNKIKGIFKGSKVGEGILDIFERKDEREVMLNGLSDLLLQCDLGTDATNVVIDEVREFLALEPTLASTDLIRVVRSSLINILLSPSSAPPSGFQTGMNFKPSESGATVWFVMGANGMGKTTTIGKLSNMLRSQGGKVGEDYKVLLASCDTYRAAARSQLEVWGDRGGVDVYGPSDVMKKNGKFEYTEEEIGKVGPSTVLYGALEETVNKGYDCLIVDTSGRLSNNVNLNKELAKMKGVIKKVTGEEPDETLLVVDSNQGSMVLESAKVWKEEVGVTSLALTKLDGLAKGGGVVGVSRELGIPVKIVGVGEKIEDLREFDAGRFVDGMLGQEGGVEKWGEIDERIEVLRGKIMASREEKQKEEGEEEEVERVEVMEVLDEKVEEVKEVVVGGADENLVKTGPSKADKRRQKLAARKRNKKLKK